MHVTPELNYLLYKYKWSQRRGVEKI